MSHMRYINIHAYVYFSTPMFFTFQTLCKKIKIFTYITYITLLYLTLQKNKLRVKNSM